MRSVLGRIDAAVRACAEALDALDARVLLPGEGAGTVWDADRAALALDRAAAAFDDLGPLDALPSQIDADDHDALREKLTDLARIHALLTMTVAREKDALRDRLLLARTATRGFGWHGGVVAGTRCDMRG